MVSALAMVAAASEAAGASPPVMLTSSENLLQPVIDQILAEQQAAVTADSALTFATPSNNATLPTSMQNLALNDLMNLLRDRSEANPLLTELPNITSGDATDPRQFGGLDNPDTHYQASNLDPDATYVINGHVGGGTEDLTLSAYVLSPVSFGQGPTLQLGDNLTVNPDGTYSVTIGPVAPAGGGNYIDNSGFNGLMVRDTLGNWAKGSGSISIQCTADCPVPDPGVTSTGLSSTEIGSMLNTLAGEFAASNKFNYMDIPDFYSQATPPNEFTPIASSATHAGGLASQAQATGDYDLQPGQALIIKVPDVTAGYNGIELGNAFYQTMGPALEQTSLNNTQAFHDPDGYTYYVVSATNPGVANWLDTTGIDKGDIFIRWQDLPTGESLPTTPITTHVVPVGDVSKYLPADTPTVSPEQFASDMAQRVLSWDYSLDTYRTSSNWVTQELYPHDLQSAMGGDNFDKVFGSEPFTPMWLRLTPALSPDMLTVFKDFLADPSASMTAIQNNLALAEKDIALPMQLAQMLLQQALAGDGQSLSSILNEVLFDPNTSIIAGILNARDDLATAIMATTKNGFPAQLGPIATWEWEHMSELTQMTPTTMASDLSSLLGPSDFLGT